MLVNTSTRTQYEGACKGTFYISGYCSSAISCAGQMRTARLTNSTAGKALLPLQYINSGSCDSILVYQAEFSTLKSEGLGGADKEIVREWISHYE